MSAYRIEYPRPKDAAPEEREDRERIALMTDGHRLLGKHHKGARDGR